MRAGLSGFSLLFVAACSTAPGPVQPPQSAPEPPVIAPPVEEPVEQPMEPAVPAPIAVDFSRIDGQTPAAVQNYLGQPSLVRRDDNVQIMIFETSACVFQVTFYEPANGDHFRAQHTDARTRKGAPSDAESCVNQVLNGPD